MATMIFTTLLFCIGMLNLETALGSLSSGSGNTWYNSVEDDYDEVFLSSLNSDDMWDVGTVLETVISNTQEKEKPLKGFIGCSTCQRGVAVLLWLVKKGKNDEHVIKTAQGFCPFVSVPKDVCKGAINTYLPTLRVIGGRADYKIDTARICYSLVGASCGGYSNWTKWEVNLPGSKPPVRPPTLPTKPARNETLKVLHLSDTHLDLFYQEGTAVKCKYRICCRAEFGVPKHGQEGAGHWGSIGCDPPVRLLHNVLKDVRLNHKDIDYVYVTGDIPPHDVWKQTRESVITSINVTTRTVDQYFPKTPVIYAMGNHESSPVNNFPSSSVEGNFNIKWLYGVLADRWGKALKHHGDMPTVHKGGYFSFKAIPGKLKIISLNMNACNVENWWLWLDDVDPDGQLKWLVDELSQSERDEEHVHILGHIPPGACLPVWSHQFNRIINRFESTVAVQFYGHTHHNNVHVFHDLESPSRTIGVSYTGQGLTLDNCDPGFNIYTVDKKDTMMVVDFQLFVAELKKANSTVEPNWASRVSAREYFGLPSLTPQAWQDLAKTAVDDEALFFKFIKYAFNGGKAPKTCDRKCRISYVCNVLSTDSTQHCSIK